MIRLKAKCDSAWEHQDKNGSKSVDFVFVTEDGNGLKINRSDEAAFEIGRTYSLDFTPIEASE